MAPRKPSENFPCRIRTPLHCQYSLPLPLARIITQTERRTKRPTLGLFYVTCAYHFYQAQPLHEPPAGSGYLPAPTPAPWLPSSDVGSDA